MSILSRGEERKTKNKVAAAGCKTDQSAVEDEMKELKSELQKVQSEVQGLRLQLLESKEREEIAAMSETQSDDDENTCRGQGNFRSQGRWSSNDESGYFETRSCYNCGLPGHISRNCFEYIRNRDDHDESQTQSSFYRAACVKVMPLGVCPERLGF